MTDAPEIECTDCDGYGFTMKRDSRLGPGIYEVSCEICNGYGWREMTPDEEADAAEAQHSDMCEGEPPVTMEEMREAAWQQKQELGL